MLTIKRILKRNKIKYILFILIASAVNSYTQQINLNSVNDAIEYVLKNNPDLVIYRQNNAKAKYEYNSLKNHWLPSISANFSGIDNRDLPVTKVPGEIFGKPGTTIEAEFGQQYNYNTGINISLNILDFQSRFSAKIAEMNVEIADANKDAYKQKLVEQTALYYYTAIISSKALKVNEEDLKIADEILAIVKQKFEEGIVDKHTVNLSKINRNSIEQNINSYKIVLEQCQSNLRIIFGLDSEAMIVFDERIDSNLTVIPSVNYIGFDKSLNLYKLQEKQSDYKVSQQRANWLPKLTISSYFGAQQYRDDFGMSFDSNDWSKVSYVSLNISMPIFNKFSTKNKVNSAIIEYDIAQNTLTNAMLKSKIEDELIIKEYNHSIEAVGAAKNNYQLSKENAGLQFQKFEQGVVGLDKYLDSFNDYLKAELAYLNLLLDSYNYYSRILSRNF
jgi:outer membrane protein